MFKRKAGNARVASVSRRGGGGNLTASSTLGSGKVSKLVSKEVRKSLTLDKLEDCRELIKNNTHNDLVTSKSRKAAFTMAEILLSLTIIGVVAAITLPSLMGNINERTWNTQRKALHARISQAIAMMPKLNGYGVVSGNENFATDVTLGQTFLTDGLSKVLKINNICDNEHLVDCGISEEVMTIEGQSSLIISEGVFMPVDIWRPILVNAFETQNGESVAMTYNPFCSQDLKNNALAVSYICVNFIYDLNGSRGPNSVGKDIGFISVIDPNEPKVVAPLPLASDAGSAKYADIGSLCQKQDEFTRVPNKYELMSMAYNQKLIGSSFMNGYYWAGGKDLKSDGTYGAWANEIFTTSLFIDNPLDVSSQVRCIKR